MSEVSGAPAEGAATPTESSSPGVDFTPVLSRMDELAGTVGELQSGFQNLLQSQQPAPEAEADPWAALFGNESEPDPYQQPQPQGLDPAQMQAAVQAEIQRGIQEGLSPLQAQMQQITIERADQRLGQMIPALANTPENQANRQQAFQLVSSALQRYPPEIANALSADPNFIAAQWKAAEADRLAQGQAPASEQIPAVEAAGGATPGGSGGQQNPVHQVMASRGRGLPSGFGGG